jgi:hypothetical protein
MTAKLTAMNYIKSIYEEKRRGKWFSPSAMRFFKTKLPQYGYNVGADYYFITSERCSLDGDQRKFTIRKMDAKYQISTVGPFQGFDSRVEAHRALRRIIEETEQCSKS